MATVLTVRHEFRVDGVLTDPTAIVLGDSTDTYGIRVTGGANVIAHNTAVTQISTGVYEYGFTEANGAAYGTEYTSWIHITYGGAEYYFDEDHEAVADDSSAMTISFSQLQEIVGRVFYGLRSGFSGAQVDDINDIIRDGLRLVYRAHHWSFFRPTQDIVTVADTSTYALPSGFDGFDDHLLTWPEGEGYYRPIPIVPQTDVRRLQAEYTITGRPEYAAIISVDYDPTVGSRRQIVFFPTPNDAYTLTGVMRLRWTMIDASNQYPIGGEVVAEAIKDACLAAGERFLDGTEGVYHEAFQRSLEAAIRQDKEATSPPTLGQDGDPLDLGGRRLSRAAYMGDVTFNDDLM